MSRGRPVLILLTAKQVAAQLQLKSERSVARLGIPSVRIGRGRGVLRYRPEDVEAYINGRLEHEITKEVRHGNRVSQTERKVGLQGLPSRAQIRQIRLGYQNGGETGRA